MTSRDNCSIPLILPLEKSGDQDENDQTHREKGITIKVLEITLESAENLPRLDLFGRCDPFCALFFCGEKRLTSVEKNTLTPSWGETFAFDVTDKCSELIVEIFDQELSLNSDLLLNSDFIGCPQTILKKFAEKITNGERPTNGKSRTALQSRLLTTMDGIPK